jgi:uncharacterized membrane protein YbhN (UPF0104 family)
MVGTLPPDDGAGVSLLTAPTPSRATSVTVAAIVAGVVVAFAATQVDPGPIGAALAAANPVWVVVAGLVAFATFAGNAGALLAVARQRVPLHHAFGAQVAGSALRLVSPGSLGTYALNTQLLRRAGATTQQAAGAVAAAEIVQFLATVPLVVAVVAVASPTTPLQVSLPSATTAAVVAGAAVAVAGAAAVPAVRRWVRGWLAGVAASLRTLAASPGRTAVALAGSTLVTLAYAGALMASVAAANGGISLRDAVLVHLAGSLLGSAVPTPGGLVGVEAVLAGGLALVGLPVATAVLAVVVFRAATFWLPLPVGLAALGRLRAAGAL